MTMDLAWNNESVKSAFFSSQTLPTDIGLWGFGIQ